MENDVINKIKSDLRSFIERFVSIDDELFYKVLDKFHFASINKKELIHEAGKVSNKIYFISEGFCRFFFINKLGDEITSDFYFAPGFITSFKSFIEQKPAEVIIQAMVKLDVAYILYDDLHQLYNSEHKLERLGRLIAEQIYIVSENHLFSLLSNTPQERYIKLLNDYPEFLKNIPLHYLSSYLGVTPESLSRIRKRGNNLSKKDLNSKIS